MYAVLPNSGLYETILFLHIFSAVVGFGSTFVWPVLSVMARRSGDLDLAAKVGLMSEEAGRKLEPFILANGVFGLILVAIVDSAYIQFSDTWITIAMTLYIVALVLSFGFHQPNLKAMAGLQKQLIEGVTGGQAGPPPQVAELEERGKKAAMFGGMLHLLFALILLDMVFKPGL